MSNLPERLKKTSTGIKSLAESALAKVQPLSNRAKAISTASMAAIAASLTKLNDIPFDVNQVQQIIDTARRYQIDKMDIVKALPDEVTKYGTKFVEEYLKGKDWSHIESQKNNSARASDPTNAIWEDASKNRARGSQDMSNSARVQASIENHFDAVLTAVRTQEFWQRTLGNAFEAGVYAAAITAFDMFLIQRDELINGTNERKQEILIDILKQSGLMAAGALPVSVFLAVLLLMVPALSTVMAPLGLLGGAGLALRLVTSLVKNPSKQEKDCLASIQGYMKGLIYDLKRDEDGSLTIDIVPLSAA